MDKFVYKVSCFLDNGCRVEPVSKTVISKRQLTSEEIQEGVSRYYNKTNEFTYDYTVTSVIIF